MRKAWLGVVVAVSGCGDRLSQGEKVVIADPAGGVVVVGKTGPSDFIDPENWRAYGSSPPRPESEAVASGTRASVVLDGGTGDARRVRVLITDPPHAGKTGEVPRRLVRPAR